MFDNKFELIRHYSKVSQRLAQESFKNVDCPKCRAAIDAAFEGKNLFER